MGKFGLNVAPNAANKLRLLDNCGGAFGKNEFSMKIEVSPLIWSENAVYLFQCLQTGDRTRGRQPADKFTQDEYYVELEIKLSSVAGPARRGG